MELPEPVVPPPTNPLPSDEPVVLEPLPVVEPPMLLLVPLSVVEPERRLSSSLKRRGSSAAGTSRCQRRVRPSRQCRLVRKPSCRCPPPRIVARGTAPGVPAGGASARDPVVAPLVCANAFAASAALAASANTTIGFRIVIDHAYTIH
jgi:hypothetical protein